MRRVWLVLLLVQLATACAGGKNEYVRTVERYADELCACKDGACVTAVNERYAARMGRQVGAVRKEDAEPVARASSRVAECLKRLTPR
jgi:hypothetical protein